MGVMKSSHGVTGHPGPQTPGMYVKATLAVELPRSGSKRFPDTHELAWAAGFFDGEGYAFGFPRNVGGKQFLDIGVNVGQSGDGPEPPAVLTRLQQALLGRGYILGPYHQGPAHHRLKWSYRVGSFEDTQAVAALLWRWLSAPKRAQFRGGLVAAKRWGKRTPPPPRRRHPNGTFA